jgi:uncharacterized protein
VAGSSLFVLIDDIASILDDVATMTKVATQKTAGVLGDDLALNAQQVAGIRADRELPVVWAVAKGSFRNKLILVPSALALSALLPWAVTPLLMIGGAYLCFEGAEKLAHKFLHKPEEDTAHHIELVEAVANPAVDMVAFEREKIQGAIRTDFVLSAEIIIIALGTAAKASLMQQFLVLSGIAIVMTVGVYGFVAGIVKLDDAGLHLSTKNSVAAQTLGRLFLAAAPKLMKFLSIAGTAAMFMVGGGILTHGIPGAHALIHNAAHALEQIAIVGGVAGFLTPLLVDALTGIAAGAVLVAIVTAVARVRGKAAH